MTVSELRKKAEELERRGLGNAKVVRLEDFDDPAPQSYGIYASDEFLDHTCLGRGFPRTNEFVFLDIDEI